MKRFLLPLVLLLAFTVQGQISTFTLENGLTVILNKDDSTPSLFGCIVVKAGSVDEPTDATGLAHYLEHMLFKGSSNVGTIDWEKEKVHYDKIIALYDKLASVPEAERTAIQKEINEESLLAGKYTINNEFSNLIQAIGGTALNASTGYDMTQYFNVFPSFMLKKWLDLQADRFENPVFRGFQAELETVYEEKNMYSDNAFQVMFEEFNKAFYGEGNPYARSIIGETEHLKTPSLSKLMEFYNTFYIPSNMALILSGDVNEEEVRQLAEASIGKWQPKGDIKRTQIGEPQLEKKTVIKKKITPMPVLMMGYKGVNTSSKDNHALTVLNNILTNSNRTGLFDQIVLDGDVQQLSLSVSSQRQVGSIIVIGIPTYDGLQRRYSSLSGIEKDIHKVLRRIMDGKIDDWLISSVKDELVMNYELGKESNLSYGMMLARTYALDTPISDLEDYVDIIKGITKDDIVAVAKKYFDAPYLEFHSQMGNPKKDKLPKPEYKPIVPATGRSEFAAKWIAEEVDVPVFKPIDFEKDISMSELAPGVKFFHNENPENDIFTLSIVYGVGSNVIPELNYSTGLMNRAGIMAQHTPYELKKEFSNLGCRVTFNNSRNNTYVTLVGKEENLAKACVLLSKTYLMPSLDEKQLNSLKGSELGQRFHETREKDSQSDALEQYLRFGDNSSYIKRLTSQDILDLTVSRLAGAFIKATQYETSVHYVGKQPFAKVQDILTKNLAFPSNLKPSVDKEETPLVSYDEPTILFLHNKDVRQSDIYLFVPGEGFDVKQKPVIDAFNEYFGGGFNGLVLQELRELRSMAYTASAYYSTPLAEQQKSRLVGYIGTQGDKTLDAITHFTSLITEMPEHPNRIDNIRNYLAQATVNATPSVRQKSRVVESWMEDGFDRDPRIEWVEKYQDLSFDDILKFYGEHIKGKPIAIGVVANKKDVDLKELQKIGKIKRIKASQLFK